MDKYQNELYKFIEYLYGVVEKQNKIIKLKDDRIKQLEEERQCLFQLISR